MRREAGAVRAVLAELPGAEHLRDASAVRGAAHTGWGGTEEAAAGAGGRCCCSRCGAINAAGDAALEAALRTAIALGFTVFATRCKQRPYIFYSSSPKNSLPLDYRYHAGSAPNAAPWLRLCWSSLYTHMDTLMRSTPDPAHHR